MRSLTLGTAIVVVATVFARTALAEDPVVERMFDVSFADRGFRATGPAAIAGIGGGGLDALGVRLDLSLGWRFDYIGAGLGRRDADEWGGIVRPEIIGSFENHSGGDRWLAGVALALGVGTREVEFNAIGAALVGTSGAGMVYGARVGTQIAIGLGVVGLEADYQFVHGATGDDSEVRILIYTDIVSVLSLFTKFGVGG